MVAGAAGVALVALIIALICVVIDAILLYTPYARRIPLLHIAVGIVILLMLFGAAASG